MSQKDILIIQASCGYPCEQDDNDKIKELEQDKLIAQWECYNIMLQSQLYGLNPILEEPKTTDEFKTILQKYCHRKTKYIYLCTHGDEQGLGNNSSIDLDWDKFALAICQSKCLQQDSILMLSCCRGGLDRVVYQLFTICDQLSYIIGARQPLNAQKLLIGYNMFLYNHIWEKIDPVIACKKVELGVDVRLTCFDRLEVYDALHANYCAIAYHDMISTSLSRENDLAIRRKRTTEVRRDNT